MRCLKVKPIGHLNGSVSYTMAVPCGTRRTKRRTFKKWLRRALEFVNRRGRSYNT